MLLEDADRAREELEAEEERRRATATRTLGELLDRFIDLLACTSSPSSCT